MLGALKRLVRLSLDRRVLEGRLAAEERALAEIGLARDRQFLSLLGLVAIESTMLRQALAAGRVLDASAAHRHFQAVEAELLTALESPGTADRIERMVDLRWRGAALLLPAE